MTGVHVNIRYVGVLILHYEIIILKVVYIIIGSQHAGMN